MRAAWMRCSTVIPSSRRNSLKRESVADLLRLAARDVDLGFPVEGILNKHKPTRLISSIRNRSLFRNTRRQVERLFRQSRMLIAEQFIVPSATPTPTPKIAPTYEPLPNSTPDATSKALEAAQKRTPMKDQVHRKQRKKRCKVPLRKVPRKGDLLPTQRKRHCKAPFVKGKKRKRNKRSRKRVPSPQRNRDSLAHHSPDLNSE